MHRCSCELSGASAISVARNSLNCRRCFGWLRRLELDLGVDEEDRGWRGDGRLGCWPLTVSTAIFPRSAIASAYRLYVYRRLS
jgi:hypothetical protein